MPWGSEAGFPANPEHMVRRSSVEGGRRLRSESSPAHGTFAIYGPHGLGPVSYVHNEENCIL